MVNTTFPVQVDKIFSTILNNLAQIKVTSPKASENFLFYYN